MMAEAAQTAIAPQGADVPVLECRNVGQVFDVGRGLLTKKKKLHAVNAANLTVERGEVLAVVGESGSGKTTLARMLLGLLPPTYGEIYFEGRPIVDITRADIARSIQPVFQDPYSSLNPRKTLESIIALPLNVHNIGTRPERRQRVVEIMEMVELPRRLLHSYPSQLSGGQRQRVAVARALAMKPEVIICDEPTSALDVSVQASILNMLQDLRKELNLTYLFISHDLSVVEHLSDRVAVMYLGHIIEFGNVDQVFDDPRHPYTKALLASVMTPDPSLGVPEYGLGAGFPNPLDPPPGCNFHPRCPEALAKCSEDEPEAETKGDRYVKCHL